jgi:hypothetical protein
LLATVNDDRRLGKESSMSFVLGLVLFVAVIGVLDAKLPWPRSRPGRGAR